MPSTLKIALGEMSARRRLLLQSLIERVGERLAPSWELADGPEQADVLLYDPSAGTAQNAAWALPVVDRGEQAAAGGASLCFPPTTAELSAFLDGAARELGAQVIDLPAGLQSLVDGVQQLIAGQRRGFMLETDDGLRFGLTAVYGAPRVHAGSDERLAERLCEPGFLQSTRLRSDEAVTGSGSLQQGQLFVWALASELAQHTYPLVRVDARLKLRRWPLPPEPFIARSEAIRICTRIGPGNADLQSLEQGEQFASSDAHTLVNAGLLLGFLHAEAVPVDAPPPPPQRKPSAGGRNGGLMTALRSAFGLTARAH